MDLAKHYEIGFVKLRWRMFIARYALCPYIKQKFYV